MDKTTILDQLERLAGLRHGWNEQGACPIDPRVVEAAARFIDLLPLDLSSSPQVVPMTRGRLQFEWHRGHRSLELEFDGPASIHFLKYDPDRGIEEEDAFAPTDAARLIELLRWFEAE